MEFSTTTIYFSLFLIVIVSFSAYGIFFLMRKVKDLEEALKQKEKSILNTFETIEKLTNDMVKYKERNIELSNTIEHGYGIKVNQEVKNIVCDYSKFETVLIYSGLHVLLERSKNVEDSKIIIKLIERIEEVMPDMKEEDLSK